jgi:1,2-dihydroxy-3-keto-5-methylthiopentene dioxygenase
MAHVTIPAEDRHLDDAGAIAAFLEPFGIGYERWDVGDRVDPDATPEAVLAAYAPEVERLKQRGGYVTADVINVTPELSGLEGMLERFRKEHTHDEDEVRFIVKGRGVFHIHPEVGPVFAIQLDAGDLINVPAGTRHWFDLCAERTIRAIRLFQDPAGWAPRYVDDPVHAAYAPLCWGPSYLPAAATARFAPAVRP